jgi:serine/threonine-protein kinase
VTAESSDRSRMIGRVLGKYTLLRLLGVGGNGAVFLAREINEKLAVPRLVAVKTFRESANAIGHLLDEARIATSLDHPNVVRLHDFGEIDGTWFFGMDFVAGETLSDLMRTIGRLPPPVSWAWPASLIATACRGLHHAHERQIIHRDIKPANLMVRYDGNVTIVDFGIAKAAKFSNVHTAVFRGTPAYMSPEQVSSRPVDARSDIFSLGTVLYELCTRSRLFHRADLPGTIRAITQEDIPPARLLAPEIPARLEEIISRMLARNRNERFASAADVERALRELLMREQFADYDAPAYMRELFGERIDHMMRISELAKTAAPDDVRLAEPRPEDRTDARNAEQAGEGDADRVELCRDSPRARHGDHRQFGDESRRQRRTAFTVQAGDDRDRFCSRDRRTRHRGVDARRGGRGAAGSGHRGGGADCPGSDPNPSRGASRRSRRATARAAPTAEGRAEARADAAPRRIEHRSHGRAGTRDEARGPRQSVLAGGRLLGRGATAPRLCQGHGRAPRMPSYARRALRADV